MPRKNKHTIAVHKIDARSSIVKYNDSGEMLVRKRTYGGARYETLFPGSPGGGKNKVQVAFTIPPWLGYVVIFGVLAVVVIAHA